MLKSLINIASGRPADRRPATRPQAGADSGYLYFQVWLLLITVMAFAFYVGYDLKFFHSMVQLDQSYLSVLILLIFAFATLHAASHIIAISQRINLANAILDGRANLRAKDAETQNTTNVSTLFGNSPQQFFEQFASELTNQKFSDVQTADKTEKGDESKNLTNRHTLEIFADQLRSPVEIGWFVVDILVRLGLIGTIIGFILILRSLIEGPLPDASEIQILLIKMSGGMGTALYTTLSGLVTAMLLGIQYLVLGRGVEQLIADLIRISERIES